MKKNKIRLSKGAAIQKTLDKMSAGWGFSETCSYMCRNFQMSERAFANYWRFAKERHEARQITANEQSDKIYISKNNQAIEDSLNNKLEQSEILLRSIAEIDSQIAELKGVKIGAVKVGGTLSITDSSDVISAKRAIGGLIKEKTNILALLGKWYNYDTPIRIEAEVTEVKDYSQAVDKLSDDAKHALVELAAQLL